MAETPFDWSDLLEWSILNTPADPAGGEDEKAAELTESDRQFLLDAMDNAVMDEQKRIKVLLHTLRLPEDPHLLWKMEKLSENKIGMIDQKHKLRSLLDMRKEDQERKRLGLPTLANETISTDVVDLKEAYYHHKLREFRSSNATSSLQSSDGSSQSRTQQTAEQQPTTLDEEEEKKQDDNDTDTNTTPPVESLQGTSSSQELSVVLGLPQYPQPPRLDDVTPEELDALLSSLPAPTPEDLQRVYASVRDQKLDALDEIHDRICRADNSIGLVTFNGLPILKRCIQSNDFEISAGALLVFGDVIQNQPRCQRAAMKAGFLPLLLEVANPLYYIPHLEEYHKNTTQDGQIEKKTIPTFVKSEYSHYGVYYPKFIIQRMRSALFALSVLLSNYSKAQVAFLFFNGMQLLTHYLELGYIIAEQQRTSSSASLLSSSPIYTLVAYLQQHERSFSTSIRRVLSIITYIIDPSYGIQTDQTSADVLQAMNATYQNTLVRISSQIEHKSSSSSLSSSSSSSSTPTTHSSDVQTVGKAEPRDWETYLTHFRDDQSRAEEIELVRRTAPFMVKHGQIHPSFFIDDNRSHSEQDTISLFPIAMHHVAQIISPRYFPYLLQHTEASVREEALLVFKLLGKSPSFLPALVESYYRDVEGVEQSIASLSLDQQDVTTRAYQYVCAAIDQRVLDIVKQTKEDPSIRDDFKPELKLISEVKALFKQKQ